MTVRVRITKDKHEHDGAIKLTVQEQLALDEILSSHVRDFATSSQSSRSSPASSASLESSSSDSPPSTYVSGSAAFDLASPKSGDIENRLPYLLHQIVLEKGLERASPHTDDHQCVAGGMPDSAGPPDPSLHNLASKQADNSCAAGDTSSEVSNTMSADAIAAIADSFPVDPLGWEPDPSAVLIPLVDVWLDLEKHISREEIASPVELRSEKNEIISYVYSSSHRISSCGGHAKDPCCRIIKRGLMRKLAQSDSSGTNVTQRISAETI